MTTIALYSDLHLELGFWEPPSVNVDVVILAGDIGAHTRGLAWAADTFGNRHGKPTVAYIGGNHEYYGAHLGLLSEMQKPEWAHRGVHFLERRALTLPGLRILGCTLWSGFSLYGPDGVHAATARAKAGINDYRMVRVAGGKELSPKDTLQLHRRTVQWLETELAAPFNGATVVATHFAPHRQCIPRKFEGSELSPYFVTDLAWLMEKYRIDVWCFGHTHTNCDFVAESGCRVVSNQLGYPNEACEGFRPSLVVEVPIGKRC